MGKLAHVIALLVLTEPGHGSDRPYNALRLAAALMARGCGVRVFLMCDAVGCALDLQTAPEEHNLADRLRKLLEAGAEVKLCGLCVETRGLQSGRFVEGVAMGSMADLAEWVEQSDKVLAF